jgi:hypothetical protein
MSRRIPSADISEPDLIDRIADSLPAEIRADYYREMRHCRSLPERRGRGCAPGLCRGIETSISKATAAAKQATIELSATFRGARRWAMVTTLGVDLCAGLLLGSILNWPFHRHQIAVGLSATAQEAPLPPLKRTPEGARAHDPRHVGR